MKTKFPTKQDKTQISAVIQDAARKLTTPELYEYRLSSHTGETLKEATGETVDDVAAQWGMMIDRSFPTGGNAAVLTVHGQSFLVTWRRVTAEADLAAKGEAIAQALSLRRDPDRADRYQTKRYQTKWGTKTALGLARTLITQLGL